MTTNTSELINLDRFAVVVNDCVSSICGAVIFIVTSARSGVALIV